MARTREFGTIRKLPSGKHYARYVDPEGRLTPSGAQVRYARTFDARVDAEAWLTDERRLISAGTWTPPEDRKRVRRDRMTLAEFAGPWLDDRPLKPSTRQLYRKHLDNHILPTLGNMPLDAITPTVIRRWHADLAPSGKTAQSHCYALLRTILGTAVEDGIITANPCHIRGAGSSKRSHKIRIATPAELDALAAALPGRYAALVPLGAWCSLRWGELTELRRRDLDLDLGIVHVSRAVTRVGSEDVVGTPKSDAGIGPVSIPPHVIPVIENHLRTYVGPEPDALLFPAATDRTKHLSPGGFRKVWTAAATSVGLDGYHVHDLRHTGQTMAAKTGATLPELMNRARQSTSAAALLYLHAVNGRDAEIARKLSEIAGF